MQLFSDCFKVVRNWAWVFQFQTATKPNVSGSGLTRGFIAGIEQKRFGSFTLHLSSMLCKLVGKHAQLWLCDDPARSCAQLIYLVP
jgi:hypothetical protein